MTDLTLINSVIFYLFLLGGTFSMDFEEFERNWSTNGTYLCAVNESIVIGSKSKIGCAMKCASESTCSTFNWYSDSRRCEIFNVASPTFEISSGKCENYLKKILWYSFCTTFSVGTEGRLYGKFGFNIVPEIFACPQDTIIRITYPFATSEPSNGETKLRYEAPFLIIRYKSFDNKLNMSIKNVHFVAQILFVDNVAYFLKKLWEDYAAGFGTFRGKYWIGLRNINRLTEGVGKTARLRIEYRTRATGIWHYNTYPRFFVSNEATKFIFNSSGYSGDTGYDLVNDFSRKWHLNRMSFSTVDRDNDNYPGGSCASNGIGWWFNQCGNGVLNSDNNPCWQAYAGDSDWAITASRIFLSYYV